MSLCLKQRTKKVCVQIFATSIGETLGGGALPLHSLFSPIGVDGRHDDYARLIDELEKGNMKGKNSIKCIDRKTGMFWNGMTLSRVFILFLIKYIISTSHKMSLYFK